MEESQFEEKLVFRFPPGINYVDYAMVHIINKEKVIGYKYIHS